MRRLSRALVVAACLGFGWQARAADLASVSAIAFGPNDTLFVADWKGGAISALRLPPAPRGADAPFNRMDLDRAIRRAFGTADVTVAGMVKRPGSNEVYIAFALGRARKPGILVVGPDGTARALDLAKLPATRIAIRDAPDSRFRFWDRTPLRSFTVTDMVWHDGRLFVAGLSNQTFSSALRIIAYPFDGKQSITSVAMYHTTHNQIETRAPIREMTFANVNGQDTLIAAYLCSPLVTIPVAALTDGAHMTGKTIAELGYGNFPDGMVTYAAGAAGKQQDYVLVTNVQRSANLIPLTAIAAADKQPGLDKWVPFGSFAGVANRQLPFAGVVAIDNLDGRLLVALRRSLRTGHLQLVTYDKTFNFRVSDFVSEYDFPGYTYAAGFQSKVIKPVVATLEQQEGFAKPAGH